MEEYSNQCVTLLVLVCTTDRETSYLYATSTTGKMQDTPQKTSREIDQVIDRLNASWDLQIPRLHGAVAVKAEIGSDLSRKCSSRIRALCWKNNVNMNSVVEEFEDKIKHNFSDWIWKPAQIPGTLPSLKSTKSFLKRDAISKSRSLTSERRHTFLEVLYEVLDEEYKLATDSDLYQRTPSQSVYDTSGQTSMASSRQASTSSFITAEEPRATSTRSISPKDAPNMRPAQHPPLKKREASQHTAASSKRAKTVTKTATAKPPPKPAKRQQSLDNMLNRHGSHVAEASSSSHATFDHSSQPDPLIRSFTTNASEEPDRVFSEAESSTPNSNVTSFMSIDTDDDDKRLTEISGTQYSGGSQLAEDYENDVELHRSIIAAETTAPASTSRGLLDDLHANGPFIAARCSLPTTLPYWYAFELYRISHSLGLDVHWLWSKLPIEYRQKQVSFDDVWQAIRALYKTLKASDAELPALPAKSIIPGWTLQDDSYYDPKSSNSISLTARLDFSEKSTSHLFDFKLNPVKYEKSCRFHRHFGADRFLTIDMPFFDRRSLPNALASILEAQGEVSQLHNSVFQWLTTNDLHIAGRKWRAFYTEPIKSRSKKKRKEEKSRQRLHLFASDGFDFDKPTQSSMKLTRHRRTPLLELMNWHLSLKDNLGATDMKLFARIQLGLSKTLPTIVLEPHEFIDVSDIPAQDENGIDVTDGTIMTDGCARISHQLARAVWICHDRPGEDIPSAFQARIGGAKGLWLVDYSGAHSGVSKRDFWIEVRKSQLKIKPRPAVRKDAHESQRTFEVVKHSSPCESGHLNVQLINIMHYCKVPRAAFRDVLNADLAEYLESLEAAMHDPLKLRIWHQLNHRTSAAELNFCGGMPDSREEELNYLLESGFAPTSCDYLNKCLKNLLKQELDSYVDKLRIRVEASTTVFCVPDPLGLLAPGEVQLNFSTMKTDPRTNLLEPHLISPKVLVARNPAHLASDVQLVKAVYYEELRHIRDVIIFPTKGRYPLADLLSGGDYDGDTVTVIWDPKLTEGFQNHGKPDLATKRECGLVSKTKLVKDVFDVDKPTSQQLEAYLHVCCSLNGIQSRLGDVTIEHEKLIYRDQRNLGKRGPEMLAALAGYLVDSAKQGDSFSNDAWDRTRKHVRQMCGVNRELPEPAYKKEKAVPANVECQNIIDYLKFNVAAGLREDVLVKFHNEWGSKSSSADIDLRRSYSIELERSRNASRAEKQAIEKILGDLGEQIKRIHVEWQRRCGKDDLEMLGADIKTKVVRNDFAQVVQELADRVRAIEPLNVDCDIRRGFEREGGGKGTRWSFLRASYMHVLHKGSSMVWKLVGDELCTMKARAHPCGRTWEMTLAARQIMKADVRRYKRLNENTDDMDGEFYDAEE